MALTRVETASGDFPWTRLLTPMVLLAGMLGPKQSQGQAAPKANSILVPGDDGCHPNRMRDCSPEELKTLIEGGSDLTKANAAVVLAGHKDVNDLRFVLKHLDTEARKGSPDAVSGLRNAAITLANLDGAQEAYTPMVMTAIEVLQARYNEKNPPANPAAMDRVVNYLTQAIQRVPAVAPQITETLVINAENKANGYGNADLAINLEKLRGDLYAPVPNSPAAVIQQRQRRPGQPY